MGGYFTITTVQESKANAALELEAKLALDTVTQKITSIESEVGVLVPAREREDEKGVFLYSIRLTER